MIFREDTRRIMTWGCYPSARSALRRHWPLMLILVGLAYASFAATLPASRELADAVRICLAASCALGLFLAPAMSVAPRLASRRLREELRRSGGTRVGRWPHDEWLRAVIPAGLYLAILAPLLFWCTRAIVPWKVHEEAGLLFRVLLIFNLAASMTLSARLAMWIAPTCRVNRARFTTLFSLAGAMGTRGVLAVVAVAASYDNSEHPLDAAIWAVGIDAVFCVVISWLLSKPTNARLRARLSEPEDRTWTATERMTERPEDFGLDMSLRQAFSWGAWRDPLARTERRTYWKLRRFAAFWALLLPLMLLPRILGLFTPIEVRMMPAIRSASWVFYPLLGWAAAWIAPAIAAWAVAPGGPFEPLLVTPVRPLRLLRAVVFGRVGVLVAICLAATALSAAYRLYVSTQVWETVTKSNGLYAADWALSFARTPTLVVLGASTGLYFAARCRSLTTALVLTYLLLGLVGVARIVSRFSPMVLLDLISSGGHDKVMVNCYSIFTVQNLLQLALCAGLAGFFLKRAARRLVLRGAD